MTTQQLDHAPHVGLWATDMMRGVTELGALPWVWPLLRNSPRGDGHPVLVLPGLGAGDASTVVLRRFLRHLGYRTYSWRLGTNLGPTARVLEGLPARLESLVERNGRKVSIIGWSLGGIFARRLARATPDSVRQVITLGSPIRLTDHKHTNAHHFYLRLQRLHAEQLPVPLEANLGPLPVPATSIYSKLDGIVWWRSCLDEPSTYAENIRTYSAHFGFGWNPAVLWVIADRLAQAEGTWAPFVPPERVPDWVYPAQE